MKKLFISKINFFYASTSIFMGLYLIRKRKSIMYNERILSNNFPSYTRKEVGEHYSNENRIWVTYKNGVYDITEFIKVHPGGEDKILMVAGGPLESFWEMYAFHKKDEILNTLEKYRIGNLNEKDIIDVKTLPNFDSLKKDNIRRSSYLFQHQSFPNCSECPNEYLLNYFFTPDDYFFVRNHNTIPTKIDIKDYKLEILDDKDEEFSLILSLENLKNDFTKTKVEAIIMCTGNRRSQMTTPTKTKGLPWNVGAIANGEWIGADLREILSKECNYNKDNCKGLNLIATGMDKDFQGVYYSVSIPLEVVFSEDNKVILAYSYNNLEDIPYEHGYPLRLIIPGYVGVRNVKWLKSLKISKNESPSPYQQRDYKIIPKNVEWDNADLSKIKPLMTHCLNSAIVEPNNGALVKDKELEIKGFAIGQYGSPIKSIEISVDEGKTWKEIAQEDIKFTKNPNSNKVFGWTLWNYKINSSLLKQGENSIWVRATDEDGNIQPENSEIIWNIRGLMNNSIHKININKL